MLLSFFRSFFFSQRQMMIIDAVAFEKMIPRGGLHVLATVFGPFDVGFVAQDAGAFLPTSGTLRKGGC
jgi:hypothetical protein